VLIGVSVGVSVAFAMLKNMKTGLCTNFYAVTIVIDYVC
jgi:hypothetical protein